jgi:SAM-dependent methyltransferase
MTSAIEFDPYSIMVGFYDQWSAHMTEDIEFYVRRAKEVRGPVVELGVGHGRVAIPVALSGQEVIGVDLSDAMITEGARRARAEGIAERITWVGGDMRSYVADPPVELVYIPFRAFLHLLETSDQLAALDSINRSLVGGGRLICNFFTPDPTVIVELSGKRKLQTEFVDERGRRCEVWAINNSEPSTQRITVDVEEEIFEGDRLIDTAGFTMYLRMVYRYEFEHLLARAGFEVEALYGGFDEKPYGPGPDEMIWVARKP